MSIQVLLGPAFVLYLIADAASAQGALDRVGWVAAGLAVGLSLVRVWAVREHAGAGGARVGYLSLSLAFALVYVAAPHALSLTVDLVHALALPLASALLVDLALGVPDAVTGAGRLRRLRVLSYAVAASTALAAVAALLPPLRLFGATWLVPARWSLSPFALWLCALALASAMRILRRRWGSGPDALASNAWGLLGLLPALAASLGAAFATRLGLDLVSAAGRLSLAFAATCVVWSHVKLVDPKQRLAVGRATRDALAALLTLVAVAGLAAALGPSLLPRAPLPLAASAVATLLLSLGLWQALRTLSQRALSPFGGRLLSALEEATRELAGASTFEEVGGVVLRACRQGSGDASAEPRLYVHSPELEVVIDLAGQPRVRAAALHGPLADWLQAQPGELVLRAPLEAQVVRMPAWRPLVEQLRTLDAACVVPLIQNAELEGALVLPRGLRRGALSLEELDALRRFARYVTGFVAVLSAQERAARRAADALFGWSRTRSEAERLRGEVSELAAQVGALRRGAARERLGDPLLAYSAPMRRLLEQSARLPPDAPLLLVAEGGTPLDPLAQHIHAQTRPEEAPFVIADAGGLLPERNAAALFDPDDPQSLWRLSRGGTLLLLDLPALSPDAQWALQQRLATHSGVRVIASTRVGPATLRERGGVLEPLLARFATALEVPPLRQRPEDLSSAILLAIDRACRQLGRPTVGIEPAAQQRLATHRWPGNLAELASIVEQSVLRCTGPRITLANLPPLSGGDPAAPGDHALDGTLESLERKVLRHALERAHGNKSQAARLLGLPRTTLVDKLRRHGLDAPPGRGAGSRTVN